MNKIVMRSVFAFMQIIFIFILSSILMALDWWPVSAFETFVIVAVYTIFFELYTIRDNINKE